MFCCISLVHSNYQTISLFVSVTQYIVSIKLLLQNLNEFYLQMILL